MKQGRLQGQASRPPDRHPPTRGARSPSAALMESGARRAVGGSALRHLAGEGRNGRDDTGDLWLIDLLSAPAAS